jgi:hypothetical protein
MDPLLRSRHASMTVLVPAALVACAAGWAYHFITVAQHLYASHG